MIVGADLRRSPVMKICDRCYTTYPTAFTTCPKDQSVLRAVSELEQGTVLRGKYEVLQRIGAGGMAVVYRVRHLHLQEEVAIKVVNGWVASDRQFLERFKTEAVVTRKLRHPNAVRVDDFDLTDDGRPFIVMEYVQGKSLRDAIRQQGRLPLAVAADIARQVALALAAAHELGIVHRDIKPENILLVPQPGGGDLIKVLDFGIAKVSRGSIEEDGQHSPTQTGIVLGTPQYVSPEQARGKRGHAQVDGRSDLYTLGVVLYEMLTGQLPFTADSPFDLLLCHLETVPTPPHVVDPAISPAMSKLVMKALEKDPAKRFQRATEMAVALANPDVVQMASAQVYVCRTEPLAAVAKQIENERVDVTHTAVATIPLKATGAGPADERRRPGRRNKWMLAGLGTAAVVVVAMYLGMAAHRKAAAAQPAIVPANPPVAKKSNAVKPRRPAGQPRRRPAGEAAAKPSNEPLDHVRAQELIAVGYRRMQQRDFEAAHDAFQEALEIEPGNPAAQKGLKASETAQNVQGIVGVFRN